MRLLSRSDGMRNGICLSLLLVVFMAGGASGLSVRDPNYNGVWQDWGGGWQYLYYSSQDQAYWRQIGSNSRLSYQYTPGQWLDCDKFGTWRNIGASGVTDRWIGDGVWHNLKNGWSYAYSASLNAGYWSDASGQRLAYFYTPGQWWDIGKISGWSILSGTDMTAAFVGDGVWHNLKNGWSYAYSASNDTGYWGTGLGQRFAYNYTPGQWWDIARAGTWSSLGGAGLTSAFVADGAWHDIKNGWTYAYLSNLDCGYWGIGSGQRFAYDYWNTQWWDIGANGGWWVLSNTGVSPDFVGDGNWHDIKNSSWFYAYLTSSDTGYWGITTSHNQRFSYQYALGQWWDRSDYASWSTLGSTNQSSGFIGDGAYHALWGSSDTAKYQYVNDYGYWSSSGTANDNDFQYNYGTGAWYRYYDGSTAFEDVTYFGNRRYVLTDYIYWDANGIKSSTPTGSSYGTDVQSIVWSDATNTQLASWYIFTPGSDLKWSGGKLQAVVVDSSVQSDGTRWMRMVEQNTKEDVITFEYDFKNNGTGASLSDILNGLGYATAYYGKTIDDLAIYGHGNTDGFFFGDWISTSNYASTYGASWTTLNNLMTNGGDLMVYACETGSATSMLNDIAARTNTKVFANINLGWDSWSGKVNNSYAYGDSNVWNGNYSGWFQGRGARVSGEQYYAITPNFNFIDQDFEYQSDTSLGRRGYDMLFNPNSPSGWQQADMVYWWNNGNGQP